MPVVRGQYLMYVSTSHALTMPVVRGTMSGTIACDSHNVCGIARVRFEVCNLPHDWLFFLPFGQFFCVFLLGVCSVCLLCPDCLVVWGFYDNTTPLKNDVPKQKIWCSTKLDPVVV